MSHRDNYVATASIEIELLMYISGNGSTINEFLLVIRQKTESKNGGNKKAKHGKLSEKQT